MPSINLRAVRFGYKNARQKIEALHGVDLSIADGEFVCVIGQSGCGKSTLLRLLAGLDMPDGGEISIGGQSVEGPGADRMIVFQDYALFPWLTAVKNISFAINRATLSHHMKILCESRLVRGERVGIWMYYSIDGEGCRHAGKLLDSVANGDMKRWLKFFKIIARIVKPFAGKAPESESDYAHCCCDGAAAEKC